jgi:hypothetical protein
MLFFGAPVSLEMPACLGFCDDMDSDPTRSNPSFIRRFIHSEASGGLVLIGTAALALIIANSPLAEAYFGVLKSYVEGSRSFTGSTMALWRFSSSW